MSEANNMIKEAMKRIASELRYYNPLADKYKGEFIHKVWAAEIEEALASEQEQRSVSEHTGEQPSTIVRRPLTDEQREEILKGWQGRNWTVGNIIDAIEAAHGITEENT